MITPEQFSRRATEDLETAISLAVTRVVGGQFTGPGGNGKIGFVQVFEDWPSFEQSFVMPTAAVLPDGDLTYGPSHFTPQLLRDTWEPVGEPGLGLYELCEATREFSLEFRAPTAAERNALKAGLEGCFVAPEVTLAPVNGARYGVLVPLPEYWGLTARLTLVSSSKLDDADNAAKNIWLGRVAIRAEAKLVKLAIVQPFRVKIVESISDQPIPTPVP